MSVSRAVADYWSGHQVCEFSKDVTIEESEAALKARNDLYPGYLELMPTEFPGLDVLDFGCGPGHDTIMFLKNGANHVYAADVSWRALEMLRDRLRAYGFEDRCTLMLVPETPTWFPPGVHHIHAAGVIHHVSNPVETLASLATGLMDDAEIRMMVYSADSWYYKEKYQGDPELFRQNADGGAPVARAWTPTQVLTMAWDAGLESKYVGSYRVSGEESGPGLSACYSLRRL